MKFSRLFRFLSAGIVSMLLFAVLAPLSFARFEVVKGENPEEDTVYTLSADETVDDDLFVTADKINIEGTVNGDLFATGGEFNMSGTVNGDLYVAGGMLNITGDIANNVKMAGGDVTLSGANVGGTVIMFGGNAKVIEGSQIGRSLLIGAGNALVSGSIGRSIIGAVSNGNLQGQVGKDVNLFASNLTLGEGASVGGNLNYGSKTEARLDGTVAGDVNWSEKIIKGPKMGNAKFNFGKGFMKSLQIIALLGTMLVGIVLVSAYPKQMMNMVEDIKEHPWWVLLIGFLALIVTPMAIILLFVTVIGVQLGIVGIVLYMLFLYIGKIVLGLALGMIIGESVFKAKKVNMYLALIGGLVIFFIFSRLPYVGPLVMIVFAMFGMGAIVRLKYNWMVSDRAAMPKAKKKSKKRK